MTSLRLPVKFHYLLTGWDYLYIRTIKYLKKKKLAERYKRTYINRDKRTSIRQGEKFDKMQRQLEREI